MRLVHYRVVKLDTPEGNKTHQLEFESISKNGQSGGYNCGVLFKGTWKECHKKKKEYMNENTKGTNIELFRK